MVAAGWFWQASYIGPSFIMKDVLRHKIQWHFCVEVMEDEGLWWCWRRWEKRGLPRNGNNRMAGLEEVAKSQF